MRKSISISIGLLVFVSLVSTSCGPAVSPGEVPTALPSESAATTPPRGTTEKIRIRFYLGEGGDDQVMVAEESAFAERFNASQDRIELVIEYGPGGTDSVGALRAMIEAGNPPDVIGPRTPGIPNQFLGMWLDLESALADQDLSDFEPSALDSQRVRGELVGLPYGVWPAVLFYNRDLFDAAGVAYPPHKYGEPYADGAEWTIEKLEEVAMQLTLDEAGNNAASPDFDPQHIAQWGFLGGGDFRGKMTLFGPGSLVDDNGNATIPDNWRAAIHWYSESIWEKHFHPSRPVEIAYDWAPFDAGVVAMHLDPTWFICCLADVPHWDIAAIPAYRGRATSRVEIGGISVLNTTEHPQEAAEVAYALASSLDLIRVWGAFPARKSLQAEFLEGIEQDYPGVDWQVALDSLEYAVAHDRPMPNYDAAYGRAEDFVDQFESVEGLDLDIEIDRFEADLQAIFSAPPGSVP